MRTATLAAGNNFLLPNWTFVAELVAFLIILYVLGRYVVPPVQKAMRQRQEMIERQVEESRQATERLQQAEQHYQQLLDEARTEAAKIRDAARNDAQGLREEMREQAQEEVARIRQNGEAELVRRREQIMRELRDDVGDLAVQLASRILGESLQDPARQSGVVNRFLDELDELPASGSRDSAAPEHG